MDQVKASNIIPIGVYCFLLGTYFLSYGGSILWGNHAAFSGPDLDVWLPVSACTIFAMGMFVVGMGIIKENHLSWKVLFFSLATCVSSIASLILAFLFFILADSSFVNSFFQTNQITSLKLISFLCFFLSEIIVLYYMTRPEVVSRYGGMNDLVSPF